jgi:N-acetyl-anhydromuramyl-L-alanine amidase AmpD
MVLKLGDKGQQVSEVQKMLSILGYDLVIDGDYGGKTRRSVKAFQKKAGLMNDGVIGQSTMDTLKAHVSRKRAWKANESEAKPHDYPIEINRAHKLSPGQYIQQQKEKKQIFLHFTAGGPNARNVIDYWDSNETRVATAFVIDGYGGIFECFNPDYWSYHLGIKGTKGRLDKASIGIEICNYGPLKLKGGKYFAWPKEYSQKTIPANEVYSLPRGFRGFQYYQKFTDGQINATEQLCEFLIKKYDIDVQYEFDYSWFDYNNEVIRKTMPGIWSHTTVRTDKFDLYPDHRVLEMLNRLATKHGR